MDDSTPMVEARKSYQLTKLMHLSLSCRDDHIGRHEVSRALFCNEIAYRAALVLGDAHELFSALSWARQVGFPAQKLLLPRFGNAYDGVDVVQLARTIAPMEQSLVAGRATIPYSNAAAVLAPRLGDLRTIPAVKLSINQHTVEAAADTGNGYALVMDQRHADALGVTILVKGLPPLATLGRPPVGTEQRLGLAKTLTLGPLTLHNLLVVVVPSGNPTTDRVALGMPLLARLKQFSFEASGIVAGKPSRVCKAPLALSFASSWDGDGKLVFDARADGKAVKASIDTGATSPLVAGALLQPPGTPAGTSMAPISSRYLKVEVGGRALHFDDTPIIPSLQSAAFLVGAPILASSDVQYDFSGATVCVASRSL
jgi:predicted aspartyl protease